MYGLRAANRYAKALLEYAIEQNALDVVFQDMSLINKTIKEHKDLERMLISPIVKTTVKRSVLEKVFTTISPQVKRLLDLLIENRRLPMLGHIAGNFIIQYNSYKHNQIAVVTTALPLDEKLKGEMLQKVISLTKNPHMTLENKVDEHIIGGFILRVGDVQYNASLAYKLNKLRQDFQEKLFV